MWVIDFFINLPSPHFKAPVRSSTLEVLWTKKHAPTPSPSPSDVFIFGLEVEFVKELGGVLEYIEV